MLLPAKFSFGRIDGKDPLTQWGLIVSQGLDTFFAPHTPKPGYSFNWEKSNGITYDLEAGIYKEARVFTIQCWLLADSIDDFNAKYADLKATLYSSGTRIIYIKKYNITVGARLKAFPDFEVPVGIFREGSTFVGTEITLQFDEVMDFVIPEYPIYYGPAPHDALTEADVLALSSAEDTMAVTIHTGTAYTFFILAIQLNKSILSVVDLDEGNLDITEEYDQRRILDVDSQDHKIIVMQMAVSYLTDHRHLITLQND